MEIFEVVFRHLPIKIKLGVDSYQQNRNEQDTAFSMQTSIAQYAPQKLLQISKRGLVAFSTRSGKRTLFWWSVLRACYINIYPLYMEIFEDVLKDLTIKI